MSAVAPATFSTQSQGYMTHPLEAGNGVRVAVVATNDPKIRRRLSEILKDCDIAVEFANGFTAVKNLIATKNVAACLCGFALEDGTYRDVVKFYKRRSPEVPVIIVSTPDSSNEYDEYLASMNTGAFDFLCYPYERREVQRVLRLAISESYSIAP